MIKISKHNICGSGDPYIHIERKQQVLGNKKSSSRTEVLYKNNSSMNYDERLCNRWST